MNCPQCGYRIPTNLTAEDLEAERREVGRIQWETYSRAQQMYQRFMARVAKVKSGK
jgi:hypothetical protein